MAATTGSSGPLPVAPWRLAGLGHIAYLLRDPVAAFQALRRHGDVVVCYIGREPVYLINSPMLLHDMFVTHAEAFSKGRMYEELRSAMGNGLGTTHGPLHLYQRRVIAPTAHQDSLASYVKVMLPEAQAMASSWHDGQNLAMDQELRDHGAAMGYKALFGANVDNRLADEITTCIVAIQRAVVPRILTPPSAKRLPLPWNRRWEEHCARLDHLADRLIDANEDPTTGTATVLPLLAAATSYGTREPLTRVEMRDEVKSLLMGIPNGTGSSLAWIFYELAKAPHIQERLYNELITVLADRTPTVTDFPNLPYLRKVIDEGLRLHSVSWIQTRRTLRPVQVGAIQLPARATVLFSALAVHRDPALYADPMTYDPDRWDSTPIKNTFLPFSIGHHRCVGEHLGRLVMGILLSTVVRNWRLTLAPKTTVHAVPAAALRPNHLPMIVQAR
ncbi:cytochrome P450 [Amycolatopsis sp. cmx-11-12]|uniref:cytochrome P450 n=1 Tax=Amycolatopsis sp. cmx-11-12 TaxID=2785795 RepID=UPI003917E396